MTPEELTHYNTDDEIENSTDTSENFNRWHAAVSPGSRLPLAFLRRFITKKSHLENAYTAQLLAAQIAFCICDAFYVVSLLCS